MSFASQWVNHADELRFLTCEDFSIANTPRQVLCLTSNITLACGGIITALYLYQVYVYCKKYEGMHFKTRQRIIYLSIILMLSSIVCYAIVSMSGVYHITFFIQQSLFLQVLNYLIGKIKKMTMGIFLKIAQTGVWVIFGLLLLYLTYGLLTPAIDVGHDNIYDDDDCPGHFEVQDDGIRAFILTGMVSLFIYGVILLVKLLAREHKSLLDINSLQRRETQIKRLKISIGVIVMAEILQLTLAFVHVADNKGQECSIIDIPGSSITSILMSVIYKILTVPFPTFVILWLIWRRREVNKPFERRYSDGEINRSARFASSLSFHNRSQSKFYTPNDFSQSSPPKVLGLSLQKTDEAKL